MCAVSMAQNRPLWSCWLRVALCTHNMHSYASQNWWWWWCAKKPMVTWCFDAFSNSWY